METTLKELYEEYYRNLLSCPSDDSGQIYFICGKQNALEELASKLGIILEKKNLVTLASHVERIKSKMR